MRYTAIVHNAAGEEVEREVEITEIAQDRFRIDIDGRSFEVDAHVTGPGASSLIIGADAYHIESDCDAATGAHNLLVRGHVITAQALDVRRMRLRRAQAVAINPEGPVPVVSPMPGKVVAVLAKEGDTVSEGQGLVVVEAMKMENELKSPKSGVVQKMLAVAGSAVEGGVTLCVVE